MAAKKKLVKKNESFREASARTREKATQPRRLHKTASTAAKPVRGIKKLVLAILRPFTFLLLPFKTKPFRFVGRILSKVLLINYFRASWREVRQVTWPNRKETTKLTMAVIMFALVFGVFITVVDYGLDKLFRYIIL